MTIPYEIWATGNTETGSWNANEGRMTKHMPEGWQVKFHADARFAPLLATMKKLEYWFNTDSEVLDAMPDEDKSDHLRQLEMIRQAIRDAEK